MQYAELKKRSSAKAQKSMSLAAQSFTYFLKAKIPQY
jgi:hypothetical protein